MISSGEDIARITVGGDVSWAKILGGYDEGLNPKNADAQIGAVKVGGDWAASSLVAGAMNSGPNFGDGNDSQISGPSTQDRESVISRIASITIGGTVVGTDANVSNSDHFGFVAQSIRSFKADGVLIRLGPVPTDVPISPPHGDVRIVIIPDV